MFLSLYVIFAFVIYLLIKNVTRPKGFPPGPPLLPIIGSWYCIPPVTTGKDVANWRKKYGNIIGHKLGFRYLVFITGHEEIVAGSKHPNMQTRTSSRFFTRRTFGKKLGFLFADGPQWSRVRLFTLRYLGQEYNPILTSMMKDEMDRLFKKIKSGSTIEINADFMTLQLEVLLYMMTGPIKDEDRTEIERIRQCTNKAFDNGRITSIEVLYPFLQAIIKNEARVEAIRKTLNFFKKRIAEHIISFDSNNIRDYIDAFLLEAEKENGSGTNYFTEEELCSCMLDLLQAGNESTEKTINYLLMHVVLNPHTQKKIHEEIDRVLGKDGVPNLKNKSSLPYLEAVMNESMRISSISPLGVNHEVNENINIYGYTLPKGTMVFFAHGDTFVNPEYWVDPETFKPERFLIPGAKERLTNFGVGKRSCIGEIMAKNTIFLFVAYFFQKYHIQLPEGENPDLTPKLGFTIGPKPFKLIITERD